MEWTGARYADKPTVEVRTWIDAPPRGCGSWYPTFS